MPDTPRTALETESTADVLARLLIRNFNDAPLQHETRGTSYDSRGTRLASGTAARKLGASIDILAPGKMGCPYHLHHAQEEMFIVLEGHGTLRVAGQRLPLKPGDVVFIPAGPEYPHHIVNTSDAPLKFLSISTSEWPEICEYPDSGKYLADVKRGDVRIFDAIQRTSNSVDYWDGEPA
jgi:uncharacterized cupin superfamily protein